MFDFVDISGTRSDSDDSEEDAETTYVQVKGLKEQRPPAMIPYIQMPKMTNEQ